MAKKLEIVEQSLVVTDTVTSDVLLDVPKSDFYYRSDRLDDGYISLYNTDYQSKGFIGIPEFKLADAVDSADASFTDSTFRAFCRENLGFKVGGGTGVGGTAATTTNDASGNLTSTNVQDSLEELQGDIDLLTSGFQGDLAIADTPTTDGYYFATESGTYVNAGSVKTDISLGLNIITKQSTNYQLIVVPFSSGGVLKKEDALALLNSTENTVLSIPFFDTTYVSETQLINSVGDNITFDSSSTNGTVADGKIIFDNATRYESTDEVVVSRRNSYYCMAFTDMGDNNTDRAILGNDVASGDYMQIRLGANTLNIVASGGTFDLPVGFDKEQPFVVQIVNTTDGMNCWLNGELLNQSNAGLVTDGVFKMNTIGRLTTAIARVAEGGFVYMKASNTVANRNELNKDLTILSNMMGIQPTEIVDSPKKNVNVVLMTGQSNADGRGKLSSTGFNLSFSSIKQFNVNKLDVEPINFIYNSGTQYLSPLHSLCTAIEKSSTAPTFIIKQATGGTGFANNDWNQGDTQYNNLLNKFNYFEQYAKAHNLQPNYTMIFILGETDGDNAPDAAAFEAALTQFLSDIRTDFNLSKLQVIIGRLSSTQTSVTELATIRTAQANVAALTTDNHLLDTDSYASDGLHFTEAGNINYGYGLYELMHTQGLLL